LNATKSTREKEPTPSSNQPAVDERKSQVVELRFFGGLTVEEAAEVLKISEETVKRDWKLAKLWLLRELTPEAENGH
jgi:DNA-directed RNA polymerase specialized sigma24 family protein